MTKANWQLPKGVRRGTWDYITSKSIAADYDNYVSNNPLLQVDEAIVRKLVQEHPAESPRVADLGCGTGRIAQALLPLGCAMINVDLSEHMLAEVENSLKDEYQRSSTQLCCSLVDIADHINASSVDVATCLFSSIGMIAGRVNRQKFLRSTKHILAPNGVFLLHVHNRTSSWFDPGGPKWLLGGWLRSWYDRSQEVGDRVYAYRGLPSMFLHIYSHRELLHDLRAAGFSRVNTLAINIRGDQVHAKKRLGHPLRSGGYFAICTH